MGGITVPLYLVGYVSETSTIVVDFKCNDTTIRNGVRTIGFEMMRNEAWICGATDRSQNIVSA